MESNIGKRSFTQAVASSRYWVLRATLASWLLLAMSVCFAQTATVSYTFSIDTDGDGVSDESDNCTLIANADQRDTNGDGFGNICDPDFNYDGVVGFLDMGYFSGVLFSSDPDADINGDGVVNFLDFPTYVAFIFMPPGPSGLVP